MGIEGNRFIFVVFSATNNSEKNNGKFNKSKNCKRKRKWKRCTEELINRVGNQTVWGWHMDAVMPHLVYDVELPD